MKNWSLILSIAFTSIVIIACGIFLLNFLKPKAAGIRIDTTPEASVYINGSLMGKTPYKGTAGSGEIDLKLVPDQGLVAFESKITLVSGVETVVRREFAKSDDESSGDILSFEKTNARETSLVVVSSPENAQVSIDGTTKGFAPYKTTSISPAEHQITIKAVNYQDRIMTVNTVAGYTLTIYAKLARTSESLNPSPSPTPTPALTYVEIGKTPTGFLRVRTEAGSKGEEIAQVKPGERFRYLETDSSTGWYKIEYEEPKAGLPKGIEGWVSNQYTKIVNSNGETTTASPTPTPSS